MTNEELIKIIDNIIEEQAKDGWFDVDTVGTELEDNYGIEDYEDYYDIICDRVDATCKE